MHLISLELCPWAMAASSRLRLAQYTSLSSKCKRYPDIMTYFTPVPSNSLQASFDILRSGLHWDAVQLLCHRTLVKGFQRLGIFKSPNSPGSGSWNSEEATLASGVSAAFFPHGVGHSLGMDVHDVPSASKPTINDTIKTVEGHPSFYDFLRLRLPLEAGMVVVC